MKRELRYWPGDVEFETYLFSETGRSHRFHLTMARVDVIIERMRAAGWARDGSTELQRPPSPPGLRWCSACERHLPVKAFDNRTASQDNLAYLCRGCKRQKRQDWDAGGKEYAQ